MDRCSCSKIIPTVSLDIYSMPLLKLNDYRTEMINIPRHEGLYLPLELEGRAAWDTGPPLQNPLKTPNPKACVPNLVPMNRHGSKLDKCVSQIQSATYRRAEPA